jgi:hypothetical protein
MKKIFVVLFTLIAFTSIAQVTTPRFDQSGRYPASKANAYIVATDTAGADTLFIKPTSMRTIVKVSVIDSFTVKFSSVVNSYFGDEVIFVATNSSGASHKLKVASTNATKASTGDITLASTLGAVWRFIFNGVKWVEVSRAVQ